MKPSSVTLGLPYVSRLKRHNVRNPGELRNHYVAFLQNIHGMGEVTDPILNGKLVDSTRATLHIWLKSPVPMVRCLLSQQI